MIQIEVHGYITILILTDSILLFEIGSAYIYVRSEFVASDVAADDRFGCSVSIYGNIAVNGSRLHVHRECIKLYTSYLNEGGSMSTDNR